MTREERRQQGICYDCLLPSIPGRRRCAHHLKGNAAGTLRYLGKEKGEASRKRLKPYYAEWGRSKRRGRGRFQYVKSHARRRKIEWTLGREQYIALVSLPCAYCFLPSDVEAGVGLDRLDNDRGYVDGNVVPCCSICNAVRMDRFSPDEMKLIGTVIRKIKLRRQEQNKIVTDEVRL